jgi:hypothetical protein
MQTQHVVGWLVVVAAPSESPVASIFRATSRLEVRM